jgi:hypothetical protein
MNKILFAIMLLLVQHVVIAQNVGVGIVNPTRAKFELHGAVDATTAIFGGESSGISLHRNFPGIGFNQYYFGGHRYMSNGFAGLQFFDPNAGYMAFDVFDNGATNTFCNSQKRIMAILQSGNMIIGPQLHNSSLSVSRPFGVEATAFIYGSTHHSGFNFGANEDTYIRGGKANSAVFINDIPGGKIVMPASVGINTSVQFYPMAIRQTEGVAPKGLILVESNYFNNWHFFIGTSWHNLYLYYNGVQKGYFDMMNGSYHSTSDRRVKTAIEPLWPVLDKINQLQPVSYEMMHNNPQHKRTIGFIAQDVKKLLPQLVSVTPNTKTAYKGLKDIHTLNYTALNVIAIKAIQEQQAVIAKQSRELQALEAAYEELNALAELTINTSKK